MESPVRMHGRGNFLPFPWFLEIRALPDMFPPRFPIFIPKKLITSLHIVSCLCAQRALCPKCPPAWGSLTYPSKFSSSGKTLVSFPVFPAVPSSPLPEASFLILYIQSIFITHGFHICQFSYSLKFVIPKSMLTALLWSFWTFTKH